MQSIRRILVVIEPDAETDQAESLAIRRACLLANDTGASLHLLVCDKNSSHTELLTTLKHDLLAEDFNVTAQQDWHESVHQTIIKVQQAEGSNLVIKQHIPDSPLKKALLTPDDWKLLRYCPCPVLLVKTDRPWKGSAVLAAVDVGNPDGEHCALHHTIVQYGYALARLTGIDLHVITAHPSPLLSAADPVYPLSTEVEAQYREQCQAFQAEFNVDDSHLHIAQGPADVLIPHTAHHLKAAVTVIGTVGRTGISGALIGNTAEVVLDSLESDVLVLKSEETLKHLKEALANG
ncbi:universal stress protein [Pseudomonas sp. NFR16]|uniref:universal stress protein n=1 Tax=Pseudomonas sp. NFR16 TaxID=1566248 RepID=UPI0008C22CB6|nr:universal stress protein [Pseudomonas sp. NFR16]SEJ43145.1 Nucleotide-binding universal stress protein, UspA family [Pseudomonas sp. NFR16]